MKRYVTWGDAWKFPRYLQRQPLHPNYSSQQWCMAERRTWNYLHQTVAKRIDADFLWLVEGLSARGGMLRELQPTCWLLCTGGWACLLAVSLRGISSQDLWWLRRWMSAAQCVCKEYLIQSEQLYAGSSLDGWCPFGGEGPIYLNSTRAWVEHMMCRLSLLEL